MKTKTPFLDFYMKYIQSGHFTESVGLCKEFDNNKISEQHKWMMIDHFAPSREERGKYDLSDWWGDEGEWYNHGKFTPFRQNVVLFLAAMNNEL